MKKLLSLIMTLALISSICVPAIAATDAETAAAQRLYELGLLKGRGVDADGRPDFDLDSQLTHEEAVVMLLRLEAKWQAEQVSGDGCPFTDVSGWARGYLEYAYWENLLKGCSGTFFDAKRGVTAAEYLTMVLSALCYHTESTDTDEKDFDMDRPWIKSDEIGLTDGEYDGSTKVFTRGDMARISARALDCDMNGHEGFTMFGHICEEGIHGIDNERELSAGRYFDGEKLYSGPELRALSAEFAGREQLYVYMDDLYLLLAAATGVLREQEDGGVAAEYARGPCSGDCVESRGCGYGSFSVKHYVESAGMGEYARRIVYSMPADSTHEGAEGESQPVLSIKFSEEPSRFGGYPSLMHFCDTVKYFRYGSNHYINGGSYAGFSCGYPVFVCAEDFFAYFGFDCTLKMGELEDGYVWLLAGVGVPACGAGALMGLKINNIQHKG